MTFSFLEGVDFLGGQRYKDRQTDRQTDKQKRYLTQGLTKSTRITEKINTQATRHACIKTVRHIGLAIGVVNKVRHVHIEKHTQMLVGIYNN